PHRRQKRPPAVATHRDGASRRSAKTRPPHSRSTARPAKATSKDGSKRGAWRQEPRAPGTSESTGVLILPADVFEKRIGRKLPPPEGCQALASPAKAEKSRQIVQFRREFFSFHQMTTVLTRHRGCR